MKKRFCFCIALIAIINMDVAFAQDTKTISSYGLINQDMSFDQIKAERMKVKAERAKEHMDLLNARYDLSKKTSADVQMSGGKPIPVGLTAKLMGITWLDLNKLTPGQIKSRDLFPYKPLPFADHAEAGMLFPPMITNILPRLIRFDLDFDLPEYILPDAAPAIYLTTRPDLGDVAKGRLITIDNYYEIFNGILNPKQLIQYETYHWNTRKCYKSGCDRINGTTRKNFLDAEFILIITRWNS